jgi:hypothetical protein
MKSSFAKFSYDCSVTKHHGNRIWSVAALDKSTAPRFSHTPSFLRKQESSLSGFPAAAWIPAGAGMTGKNRSGRERAG